jgi:NitT/TauT family transport system ATP-binding protein
VIRVDHVSKSFSDGSGRSVQVLRDISLDVREGKFVCLVGPSGCGKTTLLNMMAGMVSPTEGHVFYRGAVVNTINSNAGYITQRDNLLPWRTVEKNVELALELQGVPRRERQRRVAEMLARVDLSAALKKFPSQLSGGMRKRAALARTLVYEPETLLMDEPFAAVDAILRLSLHDMLMRLWEQERVTVVFVTHDLEEALLLGDEIVVFGRNPGRIMRVAQVPFARPRSLLDLRSDPAFGQKWRELWSDLEAGQAPQMSSGLAPAEAVV